MEEAPENGKESSHSAHADGMNELTNVQMNEYMYCASFITSITTNKSTLNITAVYSTSLSVRSTLLHVSTFSCHQQTVYNQSLANLHTFFK